MTIMRWALLVPALLQIASPLALSPRAAVADETASCAKPGRFLDVIMATHTRPPYPAESQRHQERGTAIFRVSIGTDGVPTNVAITWAGASQTLIDSALEYIKTHWRWQPPLRDCQPATAEMAVTVIWLQKNSAPPGSTPKPDFHVKMPPSAYPPGAAEEVEGGSTLLEIETDGQGAVTGGRVISTSGFSDLDDQSLAVVKNSPALLKGQAAGKHILSADWNPPGKVVPAYGETVIVLGDELR